MGKGGVAIAAQKKRDESYTVAETAAGGSLKRVRANPGAPTHCGKVFQWFPRSFAGVGYFSQFG